MEEKKETRESRKRYLMVKTDIIEKLSTNPLFNRDDLARLQKAISYAEQECSEKGIGKEDSQRDYEKTAKILHFFKHQFSSKDEQRERYVQEMLNLYGYNLEEMKLIHSLIKRREEGRLEGKSKSI